MRQQEMKRLEAEKRAAMDAHHRQQEEEERKRREAERKDTERREAERKDKERREAERREAERKDTERKEVDRREAERKEVERKEAERRDTERKEIERREAERREIERREIEKREAERKEIERREAERKEMERRDIERREVERRETERKEIEKREAERLEAERREVLRQQELRYEKLRQEEEAKRLEEVRLEQEIRRQFELQQQQQQFAKTATIASTAMKSKFVAADPRAGESLNVRSHLPHLARTASFHRVTDQQQQQRLDDHLGKVRTGQVHEKRDFWARSSSMDRLPQPSAASPAPRRRRLDSWNSRENTAGPAGQEVPGSRPGSAMDHASNVRNQATSSFIARSKSSAAVSSQDASPTAGPTVAVLRSMHAGNNSSSAIWSKEKYDQQTTVLHQQQQGISSHRFQEVHTNQVTETVSSWGSQQSLALTGGRTTPTPSRSTISQGLAESRSSGAVTTGAVPAAWRTATPEPSLRLVNVSVERSAGPTSEQEPAPYRQPQRTEGGQGRNKPAQPPLPPNRNQSYAGKSSRAVHCVYSKVDGFSNWGWHFLKIF